MISGPLLSFIFLGVLLAFYAMDFAFLLRYDRQRNKGRGWAWDYTLGTVAAALILILQPWLWPQLGLQINSAWGLALQVPGLVCVLVSFILHIWSRLHLQKFYAERVELQADHLVVQSGPYAHVRHPLITSFFLLAFGLFLVNPSLTTLLALLYTVWDFGRAARQEESLLAQNLPGYAEYMQRVPRFLPYICRKKHD